MLKQCMRKRNNSNVLFVMLCLDTFILWANLLQHSIKEKSDSNVSKMYHGRKEKIDEENVGDYNEWKENA